MGEYAALFVDGSGEVRARIDEERFAKELGRLHVAHIMGDLREEIAKARSDEEKSAIRARAHRRLARWGATRRRIHRMIVLADDGSALGCGDAAVGALAAHWGPAFSESKGTSEAAAERFLRYVRPFDGDARRPEFGESCEVAAHAKRSSPGPDGIPYQAWLLGRGAPLRMLYAAHMSL